MIKSHVILLNGTSSAGKSSIAKALQNQLEAPYLHVCIDSFEEMMSERHRLGDALARRTIFNNMLSGFHHSLNALAQCGNNLIIDHVLIEGVEPLNWVTECLTQISPFDVFFVGVHCSLEELQRREQARGDRPAGLAQWQFGRMHRQVAYDFEVNTSVNSTEKCAEQIKAALAQCYSGSSVAATLKLQEENTGLSH